MIVQWKRSGPSEFVARWQRLNLTLSYLPGVARWCVAVTGTRLDGTVADNLVPKERWTSYRAAMEAVDTMLTRLLVARSATVVAQQRPASTSRMVQHGKEWRAAHGS